MYPLSLIALGLLYDMGVFFTRHIRLFSSFAPPGGSHAVLAVFFDYGIPPHGVAPARFSCCSSSGKAGCREYGKAQPELLRRGFAFDHINCHKQAWDTWKTQVTRCYLSVKAQHQLDFFDRLNSVPIRVLSYCKCVEKSLP